MRKFGGSGGDGIILTQYPVSQYPDCGGWLHESIHVLKFM